MQIRHLPNTALNILLLILFNLTLISAKGGGGGGGGGGGAGRGARSGGGGSLTRNTGAVAGLVVGAVIILIIIIVIFWHRSMMKEYKRMNPMHAGSGTVKPAAEAGDLESQKRASVGKDAADAGEKKGFRLWRWT